MHRNRAAMLLPALLLAMLLGGCTVNPGVRTSTTPDRSLIFGYFDMTDSPYVLNYVMLTQDEKAGIVYRQSRMTTESDGLYFMEDVPPMKYHIPYFVAGGKLHPWSHSEKDVFAVPARAMVYVGAYKYETVQKAGAFSSEEFTLVPTDKPSETAVLKLLLKQVHDPIWKQRIQQRLSQANG